MQPHSTRFARVTLCLLIILPLAAAPTAWSQGGYQKPPQEVLDVLHAPATPTLSVSPTSDWGVLGEPVRYPPIADFAQPMLRLAGSRINPATTGPHRPQRYVNLRLINLTNGQEKPLTGLPADAAVGVPSWSPDGKRLAFVVTGANAVELWIGEAATGAVRRLPGVTLNAVMGSPIDWLPDSRTLLCTLVPAGRGKPPERSLVPGGPTVQESYGRPAPVRTYQDLLADAHDEALFEYYATSHLAVVDSASGKITTIGKPAVFDSYQGSPDGHYVLVDRIQKPYSYLVPSGLFPKEVEVWDRTGRNVYKLTSRPLGENIPIGGVATGPRNYHWQPTAPATLVWVEALDEGNPRNKVPHRDRVLWFKAPFSGSPAELLKTEHRYANIGWGERPDFAMLRDFDRDRLWSRTWFFDPQNPGGLMRLIWDQSTQERYRNPGMPLMRTLSSGHGAILQHGDAIYLRGDGASPEGDRPFLDRFNIKTLASERLFRCAEKSFESVTALLAADGSRFLTRYESLDEPPNYYVRTAGSPQKTALTKFPDPAPQLRGIRKELVKYKRADGVDLSFTIYLPPDYKAGERRPAVVWAYPLEFTDPALAGQVTGSPYRFTTIGGTSHLFFLLAGYVVLDGATMPVVGDPETVNNTYVEQIVSSAQAAVDKADQMGAIDPQRVGVGGHSYGAFMTANLLAHSDIFRAGIARSGAYNRTLTPFGFQSERRTLWEATQMYVKVSPFLHAHRIQEPILLIHGEVDNNSGTFPIQSERMYHALKGNGGNVRYVTLPHESHGYAARESVEHTLWEMIHWFNRHVKGDMVAGTPSTPAPKQE